MNRWRKLPKAVPERQVDSENPLRSVVREEQDTDTTDEDDELETQFGERKEYTEAELHINKYIVKEMKKSDPVEPFGFSLVIYFRFVEKSIKLAAILTFLLGLPLITVYNQFSQKNIGSNTAAVISPTNYDKWMHLLNHFRLTSNITSLASSYS